MNNIYGTSHFFVNITLCFLKHHIFGNKKNVFSVILNEKYVKRFTFFVNKKRDKCDVYLSVGGDRVICGPLMRHFYIM